MDYFFLVILRVFQCRVRVDLISDAFYVISSAHLRRQDRIDKGTWPPLVRKV